MTKFNMKTARPRTGSGYVKTEATPSTTTGNGAPGYTRDAKSELFLLAVSAFAGENSFYESGASRDERVVRLSREVAVSDLDWTTRFVTWLRGTANIRSAALMVALEGAYALNQAKVSGGRSLVSAALLRADEPAEALAYWTGRHGRVVPKSVKRGIADAASRLYNEYAVSKYNSVNAGYHVTDVLRLVHPKPRAPWQDDLFGHLLAARKDSAVEVPESLKMLRARRNFLALSPDELRSLIDSGEVAPMLKESGLTWEALSGAIRGKMDARAWEAVIPTLGYMALLRNLRNFSQAGVSEATLKGVAERLADPEQVARSRQLPMRFLAAYNATKNDFRFALALEQAMNVALDNVPSLSGNTLVLVDRSGSMFSTVSDKSDLTYADTAAVFGTALALRAQKSDLVEFGTGSKKMRVTTGDSLLSVINRFSALGGTNTSEAVKAHYKGHDRVIILTDEQASFSWHGDPTKQVPPTTPVYTWNLAGYRAGHGGGGPNRHWFGGLSDASFGLIELVERGNNADWPF